MWSLRQLRQSNESIVSDVRRLLSGQTQNQAILTQISENILLSDDDPKNLINQSKLLIYGNYNEFVSFRSLYS